MHSIALEEIYGAEKISLGLLVSRSPCQGLPVDKTIQTPMERKTMEWKTTTWKTVENYVRKTMKLWKTTTEYKTVQLPQTQF